ncbi:hypothetical protein JCM10296v2_005470 [Rhodotorula toruloides]
MSASGGKYDVKTHRSYRFVFNLESLGSEHLAAHYNRFKQEPAYGAEMWIESGFLSQASSYCMTLLSSDFAETAAVTTKYSEMRLTPSTSSVSQDRLALTASGTKRFIRKTGALISHSSMSRAKDLHATISDRRTAASEADFDYFDDSDDETDELYFANHPPEQHCLDVLQLAYKEIKVTKTAFTTYRAVLACLRTGYITFAPLWSTFFYSTSEQAQSRRSYIEATVGRAPPTHPYPVSPKSAFRLAHLLELEPLQHLCLANFKAQLTIKAFLRDVCSRQHLARNVVLDFVVNNWDAVTGSAEWDEIEGELERDEIKGSAPIMLELMQRAGKAGFDWSPPCLWDESATESELGEHRLKALARQQQEKLANVGSRRREVKADAADVGGIAGHDRLLAVYNSVAPLEKAEAYLTRRARDKCHAE